MKQKEQSHVKLDPDYKFTNMADLQKNAIRTESLPSQITYNAQTLSAVIDVFIAAGNILDQFKKNLFYNREFNHPKYPKTLEELEWDLKEALESLSFEQIPDQPLTDTSDSAEFIRSLHAALGISTESVELLECLKGVIAGSTEAFDSVNFNEELGDAGWYVAIGSDVSDPENGLQSNFETVINKLRVRFPDSYDDYFANERDLDTERKVLERNGQRD